MTGWESDLGKALIDDLDDMILGGVMEDSWDAEPYDFPGEQYDTDDYDGYDEDFFG